MRVLGVLILGFLIAVNSNAQTLLWEKPIDGLETFIPNDFKRTLDGGFVVTGGTFGGKSNGIIVKLDSLGKTEWEYVIDDNSFLEQWYYVTSIAQFNDSMYAYIFYDDTSSDLFLQLLNSNNRSKPVSYTHLTLPTICSV